MKFREISSSRLRVDGWPFSEVYQRNDVGSRLCRDMVRLLHRPATSTWDPEMIDPYMRRGWNKILLSFLYGFWEAIP